MEKKFKGINLVIFGILLITIIVLVIYGVIKIQNNKKEKIEVSNEEKEIVNDEVELLEDNDFIVNGIYPGLSKKEVISILGEDYTERNDKSETLYEIDYKDLGMNIVLNNENDIVEKVVLYDEKTTITRNLKVTSKIEEVINAFNEKNEEIYYFEDGKIQDGIHEGTKENVIQYVEIGLEGFTRYEYTEENKILFIIENGEVSSIIFGHGAE